MIIYNAHVIRAIQSAYDRLFEMLIEGRLTCTEYDCRKSELSYFEWKEREYKKLSYLGGKE